MKISFFPLFLLTIILWSCQQTNKQADQVEQKVPTVTIVIAQEQQYSPTLTFSGTVFANREANLGAALPGKVEKIFYTQGQKVKKGDLIVELSDEMLTQAEVENQALKKDYERVKRLREQGSISEMEYDHIKAKLDASNAKTEMVRKNTRVFAPFSGTIVERMMEEGEIYFINPGLDPGYSMRSGIVRLMQLNPVKIKFDVNERDLAHIEQGQHAEVFLDAFPGRSFSTKVSTIKPILSTITRTAPAEIVMPNPSAELMPGMFARITVTLSQQKGIFIPMICIDRLPGTGEEFVFIVENGLAKRIKISRVFTRGEWVAVTGVKHNDTLIAEGKSRIFDGQKVEVMNKKAHE